MKHLKMLGLFLIVAASLTASAGSASAATFTSPSGTAYTGSLTASLEPISSTLLKAGFANVTCVLSSIQGKVSTNNETEASGPISLVSFSSCGSATVDTISNSGTLAISKLNTAVTGTGVEVTVSALGTSCVYGFGAGTSLGTASNTSREEVALAIRANLFKISGGFLCANPAEWTANYRVTIPGPSLVD